MKQDIKKRWLKALRSGKYQKGTAQLNKDNEFCCLGVLTDLYCEETGQDWEGVSTKEFKGEGFYLPFQVMKWAGLSDGNPLVVGKGYYKSLAQLNDFKFDKFAPIADIIETQL